MTKKANYVSEERFDDTMNRIEKKLEKLDWIAEKVDWLVGKYKGHDEEHILVTGRLSENTDRLEIIEQRMGITV